MSELIHITPDGQGSNGVVTSLELVKEINMFREQEGNRSEMQHKTLLAIIRDEFDGGMQNILLTSYIHPQNNQTYEMFELTPSQAKQVLVRESKFVRRGVIAKLEKLEAKTQSIDFSDPKVVLSLAENWANETRKRLEAEKRINSLEKENIRLAPKAQLMEQVMACEQLVDIGETAKLLGLPFGRNTLFEKLREKGVFFKSKNEPMQQYVDNGYFQLKEKFIPRNSAPGFFVLTPLVTQKGLEFIAKLFGVIETKKQMAKIA